jgi:hypothetical protein
MEATSQAASWGSLIVAEALVLTKNNLSLLPARFSCQRQAKNCPPVKQPYKISIWQSDLLE